MVAKGCVITRNLRGYVLLLIGGGGGSRTRVRNYCRRRAFMLFPVL